MKVKVQGLLNAARYIEETYGQGELSGVLRAASPAVRETYTSSIAINWHAVEELCEFVDLAESRLGDGKRTLSREIGVAGARSSLKGVVLRMALYVTNPSFLMTRVAGMWRQYNDEGAMTVLEMTPEHARVELVDLPRPSATFCSIMDGWFAEVIRTLGAKGAVVQHVECRARGGARCVWDVSVPAPKPT